jgi:hypothetical protein
MASIAYHEVIDLCSSSSDGGGESDYEEYEDVYTVAKKSKSGGADWGHLPCGTMIGIFSMLAPESRRLFSHARVCSHWRTMHTLSVSRKGLDEWSSLREAICPIKQESVVPIVCEICGTHHYRDMIPYLCRACDVNEHDTEIRESDSDDEDYDSQDD